MVMLMMVAMVMVEVMIVMVVKVEVMLMLMMVMVSVSPLLLVCSEESVGGGGGDAMTAVVRGAGGGVATVCRHSDCAPTLSVERQPPAPQHTQVTTSHCPAINISNISMFSSEGCCDTSSDTVKQSDLI